MIGNSDDGRQSNFIAQMELLPKHKGGVQHQDFERLLKEGGNLSLKDTTQVVRFASNQLGFWQAEYLFSPIQSPNTFAKEETEGWGVIYRILSEGLVGKVPEVREQLDREHGLTLLRHSIERTVAYNKTRPLSRIAENVLSHISFGLSKLGFENAAMRIYARSLYPKGTVGRKG